jgi:hypothetical protein
VAAVERVVAAMTHVKYPEWRQQMIDAVRALSDPDYQRRVWLAGEGIGPDFYDSLQERIHDLFDDSEVLPDASRRVGVLLRNEAEVEALRPLGRALDALIDELGDVPDEQYLADPRWPEVVGAAEVALKVLTSESQRPGRA